MAEPAPARDQTLVLDALYALARHRPIPIEALSVLDETNLPPTDGEPLPDGDFQRPHLSYSVSALRRRYRSRDDVYVGGDMFVYYEVDGHGEVKIETLAPDVFVVFGAASRKRNSYVLWREPKAPDFVMEIASASTWRRDRDEKPGLYSSLGVREYFLYAPPDDPSIPATRRLDPPLQGFVLRAGEYERLPEMRLPDGRLSVRSGVLELCPCLSTEGELRWHDPATGEDLRTYDEAESGREAAEARAAREAAARAELEALVEELRRGPGRDA